MMHSHHTPPSPFQPYSADLTDDQRAKALKRTGEMLKSLDEIRRGLELPIEQLPIVIETYGKIAIALIAETERAELAKHTKRMPFTMRSENLGEPMQLVPGKTFAIIGRPQMGAFRPEDFAIHGDRAHWLVHDVTIGNRSQFMGKRGPAPGTEFGPGGILEHLRLETVQVAMDLVLHVEYVGPEAEGAVFEVTIVGTALTL